MSSRRGGYCYLRSCYVPPTSDQVDPDRDNVVKSINFEMQENRSCRLSRNTVSLLRNAFNLECEHRASRYTHPSMHNETCACISCLEDKRADLVRVSHWPLSSGIALFCFYQQRIVHLFVLTLGIELNRTLRYALDPKIIRNVPKMVVPSSIAQYRLCTQSRVF